MISSGKSTDPVSTSTKTTTYSNDLQCVKQTQQSDSFRPFLLFCPFRPFCRNCPKCVATHAHSKAHFSKARKATTPRSKQTNGERPNITLQTNTSARKVTSLSSSVLKRTSKHSKQVHKSKHKGTLQAASSYARLAHDARAIRHIALLQRDVA